MQECSQLFSPLGPTFNDPRFDDTPEVAYEGAVLKQIMGLRARIEDAGNHAPGQRVDYISDIDETTVTLFAVGSTPTLPVLAVDTDGDGICDDVNPALVPTSGMVMMPNEALAVAHGAADRLRRGRLHRRRGPSSPACATRSVKRRSRRLRRRSARRRHRRDVRAAGLRQGQADLLGAADPRSRCVRRIPRRLGEPSARGPGLRGRARRRPRRQPHGQLPAAHLHRSRRRQVQRVHAGRDRLHGQARRHRHGHRGLDLYRAASRRQSRHLPEIGRGARPGASSSSATAASLCRFVRGF